MENVYINSTGSFLPSEPISNSEMENYIGTLSHSDERTGRLILRHNGIKFRHYALDKDGKHQFTNSELAANAIENALYHSEVHNNEVDYLAAATTQGDVLVPGFGSTVHNSSNLNPLEIASFQSVCVSGMMAIKAAYLNIKCGEKNKAISCASEFSSRWFRPGFYENKSMDMKQCDFLRWTLSDGAGAVLMESTPNQHNHSLKIEWIDICSYADRFQPCMYAGSPSNLKASYKPWSSYAAPEEAVLDGAVVLKQDFDLLYRMFPTWAGHYLKLVDQGKIVPDEIDYFLPHYSAKSLGEKMKKMLRSNGAMIAEDKWFNNLEKFGNTGSASIYLMLDELFKSQKLKVGQKLLCFVPESGQCSVAFMMLSVVSPKSGGVINE